MSTKPSPKRGSKPGARKGPSPILIPGQGKSSLVNKIGGWLRALRRGTPSRQPPPTAPEPVVQEGPEPPMDMNPPEPDTVATTLPPLETPSHRATVQMLPGRLEPLLPEVIQQEVRFSRAPGNEQEVTLGWELGEPPHHVTLDHPSIQPLHAKMTFQNGNWMIESLATNDPVEINGTPVPASAGPYLLAAGDQVRIGDALFRFFLP